MYYVLVQNRNGRESAVQISKALYDVLFNAYGNTTSKVYDTGNTFNPYHIYECDKPIEEYAAVLSAAAIRTFNYCYIA